MTWLLIALIAGAWAAQTWLAWRQSRVFMAEVARLRRRGRVAVGRAGGRRIGRSAFAAVAADSANRVVEVVTLTGVTVWARPRTVGTWDGEPLAVVTGLDGDRVDRAVAEAARTLTTSTSDDGPAVEEDATAPAARQPAGSPS